MMYGTESFLICIHRITEHVNPNVLVLSQAEIHIP